MALSGKFEADFSAFEKACEDSEVKLKSMATGAEKVGTALNKAVDEFSGRKVIQEATVMAEAFDRLRSQGIALTNAELAKMGTVAQTAAAKLTAMGQDVPLGIQRIADAAAAAAAKLRAVGQDGPAGIQKMADSARGLQAGPMTSMLGTATELAGAFGLVFSVQKVGEFAAEVLRSTAAIADLSAATGVAMADVQAFTYVGASFGVDAETMAKAVEQLSAKLASGDKSAVGAVQALGLNVKSLIASGPKEAFLTVADAAGHLADPMQKGAISAEVFGGKLGKVLLPALGELRAQMAAIPKDAIISDLNVQRADAFDDALAHLSIRAKAWAAEGAGALIEGFTAWKDALTGSTTELEVSGVKFGDLKNTIDATAATVTTAVTAADLMANTLKAWRTEGVEPLTAAQTAAIEEGLKFGKAQGEIAKAVGASEVAVHQYAESFKAAQIEQKKFDDAMKEIDSVGVGFEGTINTIDGAVVEMMRSLNAAGVSVKTLGTYFSLTDAQGAAFTAMLKAEADAAKQQIGIDAEVVKARNQHYAAINAGSHDSMAAQANDSYLAAEAQIAAMKKSRTYSVEAEMEIWAAAKQTNDNKRQVYLEADRYTKEHYQKLADQAKLAYDDALDTASSHTTLEIQMLAEKWREAESASQHWAAQANEDLEKVGAGADKTASKIDSLARKQSSATSGGGSGSSGGGGGGTPEGPDLTGKYLPPGAKMPEGYTRDQFGDLITVAANKARLTGGSFDLPQLTQAQFDAMGGEKRIAAIEGQYAMNPGRMSGGSGTTGLAQSDYNGYLYMLQEQRDYAALKNFRQQNGDSSSGASTPTPAWTMPAAAIVTTGYAGAGGGGVGGASLADALAARGGGSTTVVNNTFHVNGDADSVARGVADKIMDSVMQMPRFG